MQNIAGENNLAETAFFVNEGSGFRIRWFTPTSEVDLCEHTTLASSFVLFNISGYDKNKIELNSRKGKLIITKEDDLIGLNFPSKDPKLFKTNKVLVDALGKTPNEVYFINQQFVFLMTKKPSKI